MLMIWRYLLFLMKKFLTKFRPTKILNQKNLIKKKILMKKSKYYQKLPDYRRNYYLTHKKELSCILKVLVQSGLFEVYFFWKFLEFMLYFASGYTHFHYFVYHFYHNCAIQHLMIEKFLKICNTDSFIWN